MELIYASGGERFDLQYVRSIAAYPIGTVVELSDHSIAVVSKNIPGLSLYPHVRVLKHANGETLLSLQDTDIVKQNLTIVRVLTAAESFSLSRELNHSIR